MMQSTFADDVNKMCQLTAIEEAFVQYGREVDLAQIKNVQSQLNISGYGSLVVDGILGRGTRLAIQRLCLDYKVKASDGLTSQLISLLEMTVAVSTAYPDWRKLIQMDVFKQWVTQQPDQDNINATLQSGPAVQVIKVLNGYQGKEPIALKKVVVSTPPIVAKPPIVSKAKFETVSGPLFFYRWQPPDEKPPKEKTFEPTQSNSEASDSAKPLPDAILKTLVAINGKAYPNVFLFKRALAKLFEESGHTKYLPYQDKIIRLARNGPIETSQPIKLSGDGCGCSRDFSSLVYGFYPFWLATEKIQVVDFSFFDRIGFYALSLNAQGNIQNHLQWSNNWNIAEFINKAHKHKVKVDLTVYASDWQAWSEEVMNNAVDSIVTTVTQQFHSNTKKWRTYFPFVDDTSSVSTDGVTLFFDDYTLSDSGKSIVSLVTKIAKRLNDKGSDAKINILLGLKLGSVKQNISLFESLASIVLDTEGSKAKVDYIFTFLQEPTTNSKKTLRQILENAFSGVKRQTVLRKIVPILSPAGHDKDPDGVFVQFTDDLIYSQDNFAGIGFWPLPLDTDKATSTIKAKLLKLYKEENDVPHLSDVIDTYAPWLCEFACPNRWLFRISLDLLAGVLVLYALFAIWVYRLRLLYRQYVLVFLVVGLVAMLIVLISLVCDPFWKDRADKVIIAVLGVAFVAVIWRYVSKATQRPLP